MSFVKRTVFFNFVLLQAAWKVSLGTRFPVSYQIFNKAGRITSPNFPNLYPNNIIRLWNITVPDGYQIKLNFTYFDLSASSVCDRDFVQIQDGVLRTSDIIVRMCGHVSPGKTVFSTAQRLQIYFETDIKFSYKGFDASFEALSLTKDFIAKLKQEHSSCPGSKENARDCKCVQVVSGHKFYLRVNCSSLKLASIPNRGLPKVSSLLDMSNNELRRIASSNFTGLSELRVLILANNKIEIVENRSFGSLTSLFELDLSKNRLRQVYRETFHGPQYLSTLRLGENLVQMIDGTTFRDLPLLIEIDLRQNKINEVDEQSFQKQMFLHFLNLDGNELQRIQLQSNSLSTLNLGHNKISVILSGSFPGLPLLYSLDLSYNNIEIIDPEAFSGVPEVLILLLGNNKISSLANGTLTRMTSLEYLDISRNRITVIGDDYFQNLSQLYFLDLAYNPIRRIDSNAFSSNQELKYVILISNSMDVLQPHHLFGPRDLVIELFYHSHLGFEKVSHKTICRLSPDTLVMYTNASLIHIPRAPSSELVRYDLSYNRINFADLVSTPGFACSFLGVKIGTTCYPCPLGTYGGSQDDCIACPAGGFYQDEFAYTGKSADGLGCKRCPLGHFVPPNAAPGKAITDCILCPQGTVHSHYAGFKGCECLPNYHRLDRFGACKRCPSRGLTCQNETVSLQQGFFWKWSSNESLFNYQKFSADLLITNNSYKQQNFQGTVPQVYLCPLPKACQGGMESKCSNGYSGPLCAVCSKGYYQLLHHCRKCPETMWFIIQLCGIVIVMAVLTASIVVARKRCLSGRAVGDMILARLKIIIGFYQVTSSTLNTFSYVEWPSPLLTVVQYANIVQLNLLQIIPLQCFVDNLTMNAYMRFVIIMGLNIAVILLAIIVYQLRKLMLINNSSLTRDELMESLSCSKAQIYRIVCLVIFVTYPWTCEAILHLLSCQEICSANQRDSCQCFLRADFTVQCFTNQYNKYIILAYTSLAVFIALPAVTLFLLWKYHHKKIFPQRRTKRYRGNEISIGLNLLYENYSPRCWFWEFIEVSRRVWVTSTLFLLEAETRSHLGVAAIASGIYCVLVAYYKPISDKLEHWLQLISLVATFVTMNVGMLLKIPAEEAHSSGLVQKDSVFVSVVLVAVNVTVVGLIVVHCISTLIKAVNNLRKSTQCGVECCVAFMTQMIGAGEHDADI